MNRYQAQVKVGGFTLEIAVYADSPSHARLLLQQQFGECHAASSNLAHLFPSEQ